MPKRRRRGWVRGDWLVQDEESGFTTYGTEVGRDYYGVLKVKDQLDPAHPQMFIRAKEDPYPVYPVHPPFRQYAEICLTQQGPFVGTTNVPAPFGPATELYQAGVGEAVIECDLYVY